MAASTAGSGVGAGAASRGLGSALTFVTAPRVGRSGPTVHPNPLVYQACCVERVKRMREVLDLPASLT